MQLLYVIDSVVPAGAERSLLALVPHYVRHGIDVEIAYLLDRRGLQDDLVDAGARLVCVDGPNGRLGWLQRLTRLVRAERPDLVHTTLFEADVLGRVAARSARTPVVSTLAAAPYGPSHLSDPALRGWRVRSSQVVDALTARLTERLHAVARSVADDMSGRLHYPRDRIEVIPRGREPAILGRRSAERRAATRHDLGLAERTPFVLAVARHEHQKGLDVLMRALPQLRDALPDVRVMVAGRRGNQTEELQAMIRDLGVGSVVELLGTRDDVSDLMAAADVFVMPSRREGSPGALIEAMALELPAVVVDIPEAREVVSVDEARFVPVDVPSALALALLETLEDREGARRRADRAYSTFCDRFTIGAVAERMMEFYGRSLARDG